MFSKCRTVYGYTCIWCNKVILINFRIWHSFMVHIYVDKIKVITREGRVLILSYEEKELEDFILWQVSSSLRQIVTYFKSIRHWEWFHVLLVCKILMKLYAKDKKYWWRRQSQSTY